MTIDPDVLGTSVGPVPVSWTERDTLLYALAVGAGQQDPLAELALTTENTDGHPQVVLPTFAVGLIHYQGPSIDLGPIDPSTRLHAEQSLELAGPLPPSGTAEVTTRVAALYDKGSDAIVVFESELLGPSGAWLARSRSASFLRGAGGFGGDRGPRSASPIPDRAPDVEITAPTRPDQALLYRLCGDRNRLHSDPAVATKGGFERPILHGLCTYGIAGRVLLEAFCDGDATRVRSVSGRFARPVLPGETLTVLGWKHQDGSVFQLRDAGGAVVIDRGEFGHE